MFPVSSQFLAALREPHQVSIHAEVWYDGVKVVPNLWLKDGSVSVDRGSDVRRTASLDVGDPALIPNTFDDPLLPHGSEVVLYRGVVTVDGFAEEVPLGVLRIDSIDQSKPGNTIRLECSDRWSAINDDRFHAPSAPVKGAKVLDEVKRLLRQTFPSVPIVENVTSDVTVPAGLVYEEERGEAINQLAAAAGAECYFDVLGRFVIAPIPRLNAAVPVWTVSGGEHGVLVETATRVERDGVYNAVVAYGETAGETAPPRAVAKIAAGRLRWGGPFGRVTRYYSSPFITTVAQAQSAANLLRDSYDGLPRALTFGSVVNPALEAGDAVLVDSIDKGTDIHLMQSFTIPLTAAGAMTADTLSAPFLLEG